MPRVPYIEPDGAPEDVARVFASVRQRTGRVLGFFRVLAELFHQHRNQAGRAGIERQLEPDIPA